MESTSMLLDRKNSYCECNIQIQCNSNQSSNDYFSQNRKRESKNVYGNKHHFSIPNQEAWKQSRCSPLSRLMDKENMVHIHNGIFLSYKKKKTKFTGKRVYLEFTILSKVIQTQKDKQYMFLSYLYLSSKCIPVCI